MNDLYTAELTVELARATGAAALVNHGLDRNRIDLNRVSAAAAAAPAFLDELAALLAAAIARHGRAVLLAIHGWNVVQPVVDVGTGARVGAADAHAAISAGFAATAVPALGAALAAAGIGMSVGARYPARARENLLQLFTRRYVDDPRPAIRALAALAEHTEALQLELGIPLRWPGRWRTALVAALAAAAPALAGAAGPAAPLPPPAAARDLPRALEFVAGDLAGAVRTGPEGGRLLLLLPDGGLALFTGDGAADDGGRLAVRANADGLHVRYAGPLLRFPDSTPFLDLELGLRRASLIEGELDLALAAGSGFGRIHGGARVDGTALAIVGHGFGGAVRGTAFAADYLRVALRLDERRALVLTAGAPGGRAQGQLHRDGTAVAVERAQIRLGPAAAPLAQLALDAEVPGLGRVCLPIVSARQVPVIQRRSPPRRLLLATLRIEGHETPAGWAELAHPLPSPP